MKKTLIILVSLLILCSCSQGNIPSETFSSESSNVSSSDSAISETGLFDMSGNEIDLGSRALISFELDYILGWNLCCEGYVPISAKFRIFDGEITQTYSEYYMNRDPWGGKEAVCNNSSYYFESESGVPGIFVMENITDPYSEEVSEELNFYPYYNEDGSGFYLIHERNEISEQLLKEKEILTLANGTEQKVQPFNIYCRDRESGEK